MDEALVRVKRDDKAGCMRRDSKAQAMAKADSKDYTRTDNKVQTTQEQKKRHRHI